MTIRCSVIATAIAAATVIGCAARVPSPEPLTLDRVECARCRMLISTDRCAAQIVSAVEETRFYDDVGCMAADWPAHSTRARAFVRVANAWVDAGTAAYARSSSAHTAMGSGVLPFASAADARASSSAGPVMTFDEIVRATGAHP